MSPLRLFWKRLLCRHEHLKFHRNMYGDECRQAGWNRSLWYCEDCHSLVKKPYLCMDGKPNTA